jgi:plastocyanin
MGNRRTTSRWSWRAVLAAAGFVAVLGQTGQAPAATGAGVSIEHFQYGPNVLTVPVGTTVTWTNHDEETHTVTSSTGAFSSAGLGNDETFAQRFTQRGTYQYFCALHPHMRATVVVQ